MMTAPVPMSLYCMKCNNKLFEGSDLCFYSQTHSSTHLIIIPEKHAIIKEEAERKVSTITLTKQTSKRREKISEWMMCCSGCESHVGNEGRVGPRREPIFCFNSYQTYLATTDNKCKAESGWTTPAKASATGIPCRDYHTFYGEGVMGYSDGRQIKMLPMVRPSPQSLSPSSSSPHSKGLHMSDLARDKPRSYQVECFVQACLDNTILYLPTGGGKTLVSVMVARFMKRLNPDKQVIFVVDRVPLVFQQGQYFREQSAGTWEVLMACGETFQDVQRYERPLESYDVICCTAQTLLNWLGSKKIWFENVCCLIIDEIHHAVRKHPFVVIMETYYRAVKEVYRPLFLGLTASPASKNALLSMNIALDNLGMLCMARIHTPVIYAQNLEVVTNRPNLTFIPVEDSPDALSLEGLINDFCQAVLISKMLHIMHYSTDFVKGEAVTRFLLRKLLEAAHDSRSEHAARLGMILQNMFSSLEMASVMGTLYAKKHLLELLTEITTDRDAALWNDVDNAHIELFRRKLEAGGGGFDTISPKVDALLPVLSDGIGPNDRIIIFVQTKRTARWLCKLLSEEDTIRQSLAPKVFVGQASGQVGGMTWQHQQKQVLCSFHSGETRLLVATSVLQEGLDVPACNKIILFDQTWSLTSFVQSRGRARSRASQYIVICSVLEKARYEDMTSLEPILHELILTRIRPDKDSRALSGPPVKFDFACLRAIYELVDQVKQVEHSWQRNDTENCIDLNLSMPRGVEQFIDLSIVLHGSAPFPEDVSVEGTLAEGMKRTPRPSTQAHFTDSLHFEGKVSKEMILKGGKSLINTIDKVLNLVQKCCPQDGMASLSFKHERSRHESTHFIATDVAFGTLMTASTFNSTSTISEQPIRFTIEPIKRVLRLFFTDITEIFRIDISFSTIDQMLIYSQDSGNTQPQVYIPMRRPPLLFSTINNKTEQDPLISLNMVSTSLEDCVWKRCTAVGSFKNPLKSTTHPDRSMPLGNICSYTVIRLGFTGITVSQQAALIQSLQYIEVIPLLFGTISQVPQAGLESSSIDSRLLGLFDFDRIYVIRAALDQAFPASSHRITSEFLHHLSGVPVDKLTELLSQWSECMPKQRFSDPLKVFKEIEQACGESLKGTCLALHAYQPQQNTDMIRFLTITPTRLIFHTPKAMTKNRVTRHFGTQHFVRVHLRDEDEIKLSSIRSAASLEHLFARFESFLNNGLVIAGIRFDFLAMSSSQLRDHGCWFVREHQRGEELVTAEGIRRWVGDFSAITNVAKYVARLGQSLSASQDTVEILRTSGYFAADKMVYEEIPDVERNDYNFTDGIGVISPALALKITREHLKMEIGQSKDAATHPSPGIPSAFQIRFAGYKGVVAVNPNLAWDAPILKLWLRPSQRKFKSTHNNLEVLNKSEHIDCFLNRQVIMIMSGMGVPDEAFKRLQDEMFFNLARVLMDSREARRHLISHHTGYPRLKFEEGETIQYAYEPYFRGLLLAIYRKQLGDLLTKSRVFVPRGRILMGVIDELGVLGPDQVFVQCTYRRSTDVLDGLIKLSFDPNDLEGLDDPGNRFIVTAPIAVLKNPCMHPGDMRKLNAVYHPQLAAYYVDVIVFPQTSSRPITDMCSGSDLDGDLYFVTWHPDIIPPEEHEPMDYRHEVGERKVDHAIGVEDVTQFFLKYVANDQLGSIANAHVAHVDQRPLGVRDPLCMHLAKIFSLAVDFPKTGFVASLPTEARVAAYPDFMQKGERPSYLSQKVIGQLFRKAKSVYISRDARLEVSVDPAFLIDGHERYVQAARALYSQYAYQVGRILVLYGVRSEAHVLSGAVVEDSQIGKEDVREAMNVVSSHIKQIQMGLRKETMTSFGIDDEDFEFDMKVQTEIACIASAWYAVSYGNPIEPIGIDAPILSFPWILGDVLFAIRRYKTLPVPSPPIFGSIASQAVTRFMEYSARESLSTEFLERLAFAQGMQLRMIGSSQWMLFDSHSDVNFVTDADLAQILESITSDYPSAKLQRGVIRSESTPFPFTITNDTDLINKTDQIRDAFWTEPELFVLAHVISTWARAAGLIRRTSDHAGQLPRWKLLFMVVKMLSRKEASICVDPSSGEAASHWLATFERISNFDHDEQTEIGHQLLTFFRILSLTDRVSLIDKFATSYQIDIPPEQADALIEHSFRAFHTLAQTLSLNSVIATAAGAIGEVEQDTRNARYKPPPRLLHKYGASNALFVEGSSRLVFECARSPRDLILFNLYSHRRRPHHFHLQCYDPVLREVSSTPESFLTSASTFSTFYIHASRQFNLAKGLGSASFGLLRAQIKYGHVYVTHLSRLFVEEAGTSTIEMIHLALSKGYKSVSVNKDTEEEGELTGRDMASLEIGRTLASTTVEKKAPELKLTPISDTSPSDPEVKRRKKLTLSPMTSAFESSIPSTFSIIDELVSFGFVSTGKSSGFAICTFLYDRDADRNHNLQLTYDEQLHFVRASFRPLRWFLQDIKSVEDGLVDARIALSSSRRLKFEDQLPSPLSKVNIASSSSTTITPEGTDLEKLIHATEGDNPDEDSKAVIQQGILEFHKGTIRVREPFRGKDKGLFARHFVTECFQPKPEHELLVPLLCTDPDIRAALSSSGAPPSPELLSLFIANLVHVTEYSHPDAQTGEFHTVVEKCEFEWQLALEWNQLLHDTRRDSIIRALWAVSQLGRVIIRRSQGDA